MTAVISRWLSAMLVLVALSTVAGCGDGGNRQDASEDEGSSAVTDPGPVHIHGLGINPKDGALFVATHTGLFRAPKGEETALRVADRYQDTMGFTVVGPDRFLGSGHPDLREKLPPYLGLIRSRDAGRTWESVSLLGKADFHVLEAAGQRVVGFGSDFDTRASQLMVSDNGGKTWHQRRLPSRLMVIDLAISPENADVMLAADERVLYRTEDAAQSWKRIDGEPGLLGWRADGIYRVSVGMADRSAGEVARSTDDGLTWQTTGRLGSEPAAFRAEGDALYAATHDGVVVMSRDDGRTWKTRSRPKATTTKAQ